MSDIKLLPCQFCGEESPTIERYGTSKYSTQYECGWCGCRLETSEERDHGKRWNDRPVEDALRLKLDEAVKRTAALEHALHLTAMLLSGHGSSYHRDSSNGDCMTIHNVTPEAFHKVQIAVSSALDPV